MLMGMLYAFCCFSVLRKTVELYNSIGVGFFVARFDRIGNARA